MTDRRKRLISCYRSCIHVYSWRPVIIVAFDFRTKCAVTDRIETAYIVDDLQLLLFEPNVTCMQGLEIHAYISNQGIRSGGGTQFPRELSPVNWFCTTRELGPGTAPQHLVCRVVQSLHISHMQMSIIEVFICRRLHMNTSMILICIWLICRLCTTLHTKCCGAVGGPYSLGSWVVRRTENWAGPYTL